MRMKQENIDEVLLLRIIEQRAGEAEKELFMQWHDSSDENVRLFARMKRAYELSSSDMHSTQANWKRVVDKVRAGYTVPDYIEIPDLQVAERKVGISILWRVAAMVILFLGLTFLLKNIVFDREQLVSGKDMENNEPYQLVDGSVVYLRGDSEIRLPRGFGSKNRKITLRGEAFFDVVRHDELPFTISANNTTTRVVGTSFHVLSDPAGKVQVTVVTGMVEFFSGKRDAFEIRPGEQGTYDPATGWIVKSENNDPNFHAWKTGVVVFRGTPLEEALELLGQIYAKTFVFEKEITRMPAITSTFDNQPLEAVLEELSLLLNTKTESKNDTIIFKPLS
jgi:transmembrane sensor